MKKVPTGKAVGAKASGEARRLAGHNKRTQNGEILSACWICYPLTGKRPPSQAVQTPKVLPVIVQAEEIPENREDHEKRLDVELKKTHFHDQAWACAVAECRS